MGKGDFDVSSSITGIYSAINLENKAKEVEKSMAERYSSLLKEKLDAKEEKQSAYFRNFKVAKEQLQKSSRNKRSVSLAPTLNQEQRAALGKMHSLYYNLKEASQRLASRFKREVQDIDMPLALAKKSGVSHRSIERFLNTIRWEAKSIRTQKDMRPTRFYKRDSWGNWNLNPFKTFYNDDESAFHSDIDKLQSNAKEAYQLQQALEREGAQVVNRFRSPHLRSLLGRQWQEQKQAIASLSAASDSHIVERVASYLLSSMGQA